AGVSPAPRAAAASLAGRPALRLGPLAVEAYLAWVLVMSTGAVLPLLAMGEGTSLTPEDSALLRLTLVPVLAMVPVVVALHGRPLLAELVRLPLLLALLALALLSTLWSVEPGVTLRRAVAFAAYALLGAVMGLRWSGRELVERLLWLVLFVLAASLFFQLALPGLARMGDGSWRGAFAHKNVLGQMSAFAVLVLLLAWRHRLAARPLLVVALALAFLFLLFARSATSLLVTLAVAAGFLLTGRGAMPLLAKAAFVAFAGAGLALAGLWVVLAPEEVVELLGRDLTLTGRWPLWELVLSRVAERPWLGYGFHALFTVPAFADYVLLTLGWNAPNAHSGYLEVALGLGWIGLALTLALLAQAGLRALRALGSTDPLAGEAALLFLVAYLARNLVESELLLQTHLSWLVLVALLVRTGLARAGRP
ncbi:MAG: O-antigen ligase family protein, partial [Chloroflexi bacterium]|nr:O-antigen ligase family protein [Chloroflexota bacterium]